MQGRHVNFATVSEAKSKQSKIKDASNKLRYKASEYQLQTPHGIGLIFAPNFFGIFVE